MIGVVYFQIQSKKQNLLTILNKINNGLEEVEELKLSISAINNQGIKQKISYYKLKDKEIYLKGKKPLNKNEALYKNLTLLNTENEIQKIIKSYQLVKNDKNSVTYFDKTGSHKFKKVDMYLIDQNRISIFMNSDEEIKKIELELISMDHGKSIKNMKLETLSAGQNIKEKYSYTFFKDSSLVREVEKRVDIVMMNSNKLGNNLKRQVVEIIKIDQIEQNKGKAIAYFAQDNSM